MHFAQSEEEQHLAKEGREDDPPRVLTFTSAAPPTVGDRRFDVGEAKNSNNLKLPGCQLVWTVGGASSEDKEPPDTWSTARKLSIFTEGLRCELRVAAGLCVKTKCLVFRAECSFLLTVSCRLKIRSEQFNTPSRRSVLQMLPHT